MGGSNSKKEDKDKKAKPGFLEWKKENAGGPGWYVMDVYFDKPTFITTNYRKKLE